MEKRVKYDCQDQPDPVTAVEKEETSSAKTFDLCTQSNHEH